MNLNIKILNQKEIKNMKISKKFTSIFLAGLLSASVAFSTPAVFATGDPDNPVPAFSAKYRWLSLHPHSLRPAPRALW